MMLTRRRQPTHPGVILKEHYLDPRRVTIMDLAEAAGISRKHLSQIINGHAGVTAETAVRIAEVLDTTPQLWLNLQNAVDVYHANERIKEKPVRRSAFPAPESHHATH